MWLRHTRFFTKIVYNIHRMPETQNMPMKIKEFPSKKRIDLPVKTEKPTVQSQEDSELNHVQKALDTIEKDEQEEINQEEKKKAAAESGQSLINRLRIRLTEKSEDKNEKWLRLDQRLHKLYLLIDKQSSQSAIQLCTEKFMEWERKIDTQSTKDIPRFVQEQIDREQKVNDAIQPYMKERLQKSMLHYAEKDQHMAFRTQVKEENGDYFLLSKNKKGESERWKMEQFRELAPVLYFRSTDPKKPGCVFSIDLIDGLDAIDENPEKIGQAADTALETYQREHSTEQTEALKNYDLPSDRNIVHLRVFPKKYNSVSLKGLHTSMLLSNTLKQRYQDAITIRPPIFSDDPEAALRKEIKVLLEENGNKQIHLCIDIFNHGQKGHFSFEKKLEAKHLIQIAKEFTQCSFTYNTIACYGAGMMQGMTDDKSFASDPDLQSRLAVFTQSKGDVVNMTAASHAVTIYYMHLMRALSEGKSYGEAARRADLEVKIYLPMDAEALIDGHPLVMGKPSTIGKIAS